MKSQSAMEYLMTYGWAILVIAVVLAALYSLGIFNPSTFAPKASAGSCEVVRPFGPTTTTDVHLEGTCTNMLPKYVASFNGADSGITISSPSEFPASSEPGISIFVWIKTTRSSEGVFEYYSPSNNICEGSVRLEVSPKLQADFSCDAISNGPVLDNNTWNFVGWTLKSGTSKVILYVNGIPYGPYQITPINVPTTGLEGLIGAPYPGWPYYYGSMSNVQLYNTALSSNQITALYDEGIGGDPIDLQNLVGWWPLNGNSNDYSGNNNNGKATNIAYSSTWYRTYSAP
ncbi:LamG domain protein [Candidatus Mancarchaeum acidiphilum]|uniref:LamG domain protein n=1 Tax=Candidatus Mancarchaeum acidiphilum TaxID=1920749 RepID=A0A218NN89_9ARCH|nr:LamG-like jellyroll fold domain-containing protein [Candidatus Mancarchaeum acidiphilum]ASI13925.1 LamG domain protein [Candidatus Mancarchaeum acidiphilum]ASI13928.1 LamG domain protein [Candidatus Mancarchaeum acidiphilum]ASI13931.1 LamG domain protein [Candidatus Mancarchaeum acidiphilum]